MTLVRARSTIRVAAADDHAVVLAGVRALVTTCPHIQWVGEAQDGPSLTALLAQVECDVLVLDVSMPEFQAVEAVRAIRATECAPRVLMLSAFQDVGLVRCLLAGGASGYLAKDAMPALLVQAIEKVAAGECWLSPSLAGKLLQASPPSSYERGTELTSQSLTEREQEVYELLALGSDVDGIIHHLSITRATVHRHLHHIYRKLGVSSMAEARQHARTVLNPHYNYSEKISYGSPHARHPCLSRPTVGTANPRNCKQPPDAPPRAGSGALLRSSPDGDAR